MKKEKQPKSKKIKISKRAYPIHTDTLIVSARVPVSLMEKIDRICSETGRSRSDVVGRILDNFFAEYTDFALSDIDFDTVE